MNDIIINLLKNPELQDIPILYVCRIALETVKLMEDDIYDKSINTRPNITDEIQYAIK